MNKHTLTSRLSQAGAWITLIIAAFLIIALFVGTVQRKKQQESLDKQTNNTNLILQQVKDLGQQNKDLGQQNKKLSEQNAKYAYCNATLLAEYTQTGAAIKIEDLENCILTTFPEGADILNSSPATPQGQDSSQDLGIVNQTAQNGQTNNPPNASNPQSPSNNPPSNPNPKPEPTPVLTPRPGVTVSPTFLTPGIKLDIPCVGVPQILKIC